MTNLAEALSKLLPEKDLQEKVADLEQLNLFLAKAKAMIRSSRGSFPGMTDETKIRSTWTPLLTYLKTNHNDLNFGIRDIEEAFGSSYFDEFSLGTRLSVVNKTANNYAKFLCAVGVFQSVGKGANNRDLFRLANIEQIYNFEQWAKVFEDKKGTTGVRNDLLSYLIPFKARLENPTPDPEKFKNAQIAFETIYKDFRDLAEIARVIAYDNPALFNPNSSLFEQSKADFLKGMSEYFKEMS